MSYQVGFDLGSSRTTVANGRCVTAFPRATRRRRQDGPAPDAAMETAFLLAGLAERHGEPPSRVAMTHPLSWGHETLENLRTALIDQGRADVLFVPEPHAAVLAFDEVAGLPENATVVVFDFGASGCDVAVLRKQGVWLLVGRPESVEIGGDDLDDLVVEHVVARAGELTGELRRSCVEAKELLGCYPEVRIPVVLQDQPLREVRLTRLEFEAIIRPAVEHAVDALLRAMKAAGCAPDVVLLVGGSARIPLVAREIGERILTPIIKAVDGAAALGAAIEARNLEPEPVEEPTVWVPVPREEEKPRKRLITPFVAAGVIALALAGGVAAHQAMQPREVMNEPVSVVLPPPGIATLPRMQA